MKKILHDIFIALLLRREFDRIPPWRGPAPVADENYTWWLRRHNRRIADDLGFIVRNGRIEL